MNSVIINPYITEKSTADMKKGLYVFLVRRFASKTQVASELKKLYDVTPTAVRMVNLPPHSVTFKRRSGMRSMKRKAYVQLPPKQTIPGFENLTQKDEKAQTKPKEKN